MYRSKTRVNCIGCQYCMPCSSRVNISESFKFLNNAEMFDNVDDGKFLYHGLEGKVSSCTECGQCEEKCFKKLLLETYLKGCKIL